MLPSLLLTLREGLEAALILGIIFGFLRQLRRGDLARYVWAGVVLAVALSLAVAVALHTAGASFEGRTEMLFEGMAMLLAVAVLTWMIFWMRRQTRLIKARLEADLHDMIQQGHTWALAGIAFLGVFREGVETALFLTAANIASGDGRATITGAVIGLALAAVLGWGLYAGAVRLNLRRFFDVTSILLLIFAAGLFAHALHEFVELGWLPALADPAWNLKPVLDDGSTVGSMLRVLVGYNDDPTLLEVIGYLAYWGVVLVAMNVWSGRLTTRRTAPAPNA